MPSAEPAPIAPPPGPGPAPLLVRSGDSMGVMTDALLAHLPELAALADAIEADSHRLATLGLELPQGAFRAAVERCERTAASLADEVRALRTGILWAEAGYARAERTVARLQDVAASWIASFTGRLAILALPLLVEGWAGGMLAPGGDAARADALRRWMLAHPELVTSPVFVTLVRDLVAGADDAALGALGLPPPLGLLLGEHGLGILGVGTSAGVLVGLGTASGTRAFHETPVQVERVSVRSMGTAPSGAAERLARVPDDEQVRIERYTAPGEPDRYVVYVAPTQTFSPFAEKEPWDLTSNVAGVAGISSGSIRATELAMADAGITPDSEIVLVGFSQGGLVADAVAASGRWNTVGLETYGDPGGGIELPEGIRGVAVRHSDDFVVATGGPQGPTDRTIVARQAYPDGATLPTDLPVPAHQRRAYAETARMLDEARSPQLRRELDALDSFTRDYATREGAEVTTFRYSAERVPVGALSASS